MCGLGRVPSVARRFLARAHVRAYVQNAHAHVHVHANVRGVFVRTGVCGGWGRL